MADGPLTRVAVIGLDGAEWALLEKWIAEGRLPNLSRLRDRSARCVLRNVVAYRAEAPWRQFVTGKSAARAGNWTGTVFDPATYDVFGTAALGDPFYALGEETRVIALDVPDSAPSDRLDGIQVVGWGTHSPHHPRAARPQGLLNEIDRTFGPHPNVGARLEGSWFQNGFLEALTEALIEGAGRRPGIVRWLTRRFPDWDLFITVMSETHAAGHHMWHGIDQRHPLHQGPTAPSARHGLLAAYEVVDEALGNLIALLPADTTLVVFSLHGMELNDDDVASQVLLPELLHRLLFGKALLLQPNSPRWRRRGFPPVVPNPKYKWITHLKDRFAETRPDRARRIIRMSIPPLLLDAKRALQQRIARRPPKPPWVMGSDIPAEAGLASDEIAQIKSEIDWQIPTWYRRYWPKMTAFVLPSSSDAHVRINLQGRERDGIVPLDDYEAACREVEELVRACRNPRSGEPAVREVIRMRAYDPLDTHGPDADLVVFWAGAVDAIEHPQVGIVGPFPYSRTGEHSSRGFALFSGPEIVPADLGERSALDLPPTVLALMGVMPPEQMEGTAILPIHRL